MLRNEGKRYWIMTGCLVRRKGRKPTVRYRWSECQASPQCTEQDRKILNKVMTHERKRERDEWVRIETEQDE